MSSYLDFVSWVVLPPASMQSSVAGVALKVLKYKVQSLYNKPALIVCLIYCDWLAGRSILQPWTNVAAFPPLIRLVSQYRGVICKQSFNRATCLDAVDEFILFNAANVFHAHLADNNLAA